MATPAVSDLVYYSATALSGADWKTNFDQVVAWLTDTAADFSINTLTTKAGITAGDDVAVTGNITASGDIEAATFTSAGVTGAFVPSGGIIMWSGTLANIPAGWYLCDGDNGTPDLRDKFVCGAANGANPGTTGGAATHTHTVNSHTHTIAHAHTYSGTTDNYTAPYNAAGDGSTSSPTHAHTYSGTTSTSSDNSGASGTLTSNAGSSLPPFYALAFIMKA